MNNANNREQIKQEFEYYLTHVARSSRYSNKSFNLGRSAVTSYLCFIEPEKLFDYDPAKWTHISSMYDLVKPKEVEAIVNELMNNSLFIKRDKENNQGWRSGAIMHYSCFINARSFYKYDNKVEDYTDDSVLTKTLIRYRKELPSFWEDEKYKWQAVEHFQNNWDIDAKDFGSMFVAATSKHVNLLLSVNYFPIGVIKDFAAFNETRTREMFRVLFDERRDLSERVAFFTSEAEAIRQQGGDRWKNHYQDLHALSVYLTFMYPQKYFIYKYKELKNCVSRLGDDFSFSGKTKSDFYANVVGYCEKLRQIIAADNALCETLDKLLSKSEGCYADKHRNMATVDFVYYVGKRMEDPEIQPPIQSIQFSIDKLIKDIGETGLIYTPKLIKRFAFSLMTKPFVILSGLAGSGKTQLAITFAKALVENCDKQLCVVSVGADWTNREPLLGFPNALQPDKYVRPESKVLDLLIEANKPENSNKPYFLILDEMNMSYVERYFADFLSAMESKEAIPLWNGCPEPENEDDDWDDTPVSVKLPKNLFIIGTINVDETTYMFSPKVLDRANVIEFKISADEMSSFLNEMKNVHPEIILGKCANMAASFVEIASNNDLDKDSNAIDTLKKFFGELKSVNAEFGYRSATEIFRFICQAKNNDDTAEKITYDEILDAAIVQKLLPKLHGSRKKLEPVLKQLWRLCFDGANSELPITDKNVSKAKYNESADKIWRMFESASANGFTSFAEA